MFVILGACGGGTEKPEKPVSTAAGDNVHFIILQIVCFINNNSNNYMKKLIILLLMVFCF